jgi:cellobiose phosphorylase
MAAVRSANEFAELLDVLGKTQEAKLYRQKAEVLRQSILKYGWDKDHFIYGINDWREKLGAYESKEGKIFLNPQAYAVLADIVDIKTQNELMDLVERELKCDYGYVQLKPSYTAGDEHIGRVSFMQPGTVENGSVYNHGATFKIAADCKLGRGNIAYDSVVRMIGTNPKNPSTVSGMEPYVISNMYLGPENICAGEAPMSWLTGTAGWLFRCILEYMVGICADYKGLKINPVISSDWKEVTAFRQFRGANFNITIKNPKGLECGKTVVTVNGNEIDGNIITDFDKGKAYTVVATIE